MSGTILPDTLAGHWVSVEGAEMARDYAGKTRDQLMGGQFSDMEVAYRTALTHRSDNDFEARLGTAKDRIRWLSAQLALANARVSAPTRLQVSEALVTLAQAAGAMAAFAKNGDVLGADLAESCAKMERELDAAREVLRHAAGAA